MRTIVEYPPVSTLYVILKRLGLSVTWIDGIRHSIKERKIGEIISDIVQSYNEEEFHSVEVLTEKSPIYVMWWTGVDDMPPVVRICYQNLIAKSKLHKVILITKNNINTLFPTIKDEISELVFMLENGKITIQYFSDLLRTLILDKIGGIWIDGTVFVSDGWDQYLINKSFFSGRRDEKYFFKNSSPTQGQWTSYFIASTKGNILMRFVNQCLRVCYVKSGGVIDYFAIDYIFAVAFKEIDSIEKMIKEQPLLYANLFGMDMNNEYSEEYLNKLMETAPFYKLNPRHIVREYTTLGKKTLFGELKSRYF